MVAEQSVVGKDPPTHGRGGPSPNENVAARLAGRPQHTARASLRYLGGPTCPAVRAQGHRFAPVPASVSLGLDR